MIGIEILGICACFVGVFFAEVIVEFMLVVSFFILKPEEPQPAYEEVAEPAAPADAFQPTKSDYEEVQ